MDDVALCGWRLRTEIPFPELPPWSADARAPEIELRLGTVPDELAGARVKTSFLQIGETGAARLEVPTLAVFHVTPDCITVAPRTKLSWPAIRSLVMGPVLGLLARQRGLLPLHAAAVSIDGAACVLAGHSRSGKSTLAAALVRRGAIALTDDIAVIDANTARIFPISPQLKLWRDSITALGLLPEGWPTARIGQEKFLATLPGREKAPLLPIPIGAIYVLDESASGPVAVKPLEAAETTLASHIYGAAFLDRPSGVEALARAVPVLKIERRLSFDTLDLLAEAAEADFCS